MNDDLLFVQLEARITQFEKAFQRAPKIAGDGFDRIERRAKQSGDRLESLMAGAASRAGSALKGFGVGFLGGLTAGGLEGIVSQIGNIAKGMASIGDEAKRAGLSTKAFQELKFVADQNRVSVDALTDGMKELSLRADEFIDTGSGSAAESFRTLGISASELKEKLKDPSALFTEIIGKLQQLDKASQIRIADELFGGTGGEQFVQLLDQGEEGIKRLIQRAHETGAVMSDEMIAKAAELDRKFSEVATTVGNSLKGAVIQAASALQDFLNLLQQVPGYRSQEATDKGIAAIQRGLAEQEVAQQRENHLRRIRDLQATVTKNNELGFDNADAWNALLAEQTRLRALDAQIERQKQLNAEKERTVQLETVTVPAITSDDKGNYREFQQIVLPNSVDATPDRRVDPYFDAPSSGSSASTKAAADGAVMSLIKRFEGFITNAKWDVNAFRVGYGSDTTTREGGHVERVTASTVVTLADANRDLARRIGEFQSGIQGQIGGETWRSFSEEQQAALTSVAYNYGSLPDRIVDAIRKGSPDGIGTAIRDLGDDNGGINRKRRSQEADMFFSGSGGGSTPAVLAAQQHKVAINQLQQSYQQLGQIGLGAVQGLASALQDGKLEAGELLQILGQVIQQFLQMPSVQNGSLFSGLGKSASADPWAGMRSVSGGGAGFFGSLLGMLFGGFAEGGFTGAGTKYEPAGIVHRGEFVFDKANTERIGVRNLEAMRRGRLPGFADGGLVRPPAIPALPALGSLQASQAAGPESSQPISVSVSAPITVNGSAGTPEQNAELAKRMRRELEGTMRGVAADEIRRAMRPGNTLRR
ncbi:MAG: hypothetical protein INR68_03380 [Methylobacterium mesophilicum]|nr:hypothetical protein [Methylobacterium mesophilicum]